MEPAREFKKTHRSLRSPGTDALDMTEKNCQWQFRATRRNVCGILQSSVGGSLSAVRRGTSVDVARPVPNETGFCRPQFFESHRGRHSSQSSSNTPSEAVRIRHTKQTKCAKGHREVTPNETGGMRQTMQEKVNQVMENVADSGAVLLYLTTHVLVGNGI